MLRMLTLAVLLLQFLRLLRFTEASINILDDAQTQPGRGIITLSLANLSNPIGVSSFTGLRCDQRTDCDPYFTVTLTDDSREELIYARTGVWRNQNSLMFEVFRQSVSLNGSLPSKVYLKVYTMDKHMPDDQIIAEFDAKFQLNQPDRPDKVQLFSTPRNKYVSLIAKVAVTCSQFYYGPTCSEFCRNASILTTCRPDGSLVCLDGSMDCLRTPVREAKSVSTTAERIEVPRTLVYWVIPGVCFGLLLIVLMGLLVRLLRAQSDKIIVTSPEAALESGAGDPDVFESFEHRQLPDNIDVLRSPTLLLAPADNQRFRNPVYSALRSNEAGRSASVTTQSTAVSTSVAACSSSELDHDAAAGAAVSDTAEDDDAYDELEEVLHGPAQVPRPLPPTP
ncbi:hypothetical protein BOX15_Mlig022023g1 [Macrostomum lignano]|uniref:DSL domain-containing protein n=1 Tax=Macrostomum lignano TaxID=282301 RepID=A0A267H7G7_9PLAT|nr:hypothetical protein BOX15_Mlig022023g1 [Macrostomum lignano]